MIRTKNIFIVLILIALSSCANKYEGTKYTTSVLLKTEKYEYKISYPKDWVFFVGSTDASMLNLSDGNFLHAIAVITKQYPKNVARDKKGIITGKAISGTIQIFVLDKNNITHQDLLKLIKDNPDIWSVKFLNEKNHKAFISLENIYNQLNNDKNNYGDLNVIFDIGENKFIIFSFHGSSYSRNYSYNDYTKNDKNKLGKEFYKIINSLHRYEIK